MLSELFVFYDLRTIQSFQILRKNNHHHTIDLSIPVSRANQGLVSRANQGLVSRANQGQTTKIRGNTSPHHHTFLCFKMTRVKSQCSWVCFNTPDTHFLCFKTVSDKVKYKWHGTHYLVAHFLHLKNIVRDIF